MPDAKSILSSRRVELESERAVLQRARDDAAAKLADIDARLAAYDEPLEDINDAISAVSARATRADA